MTMKFFTEAQKLEAVRQVLEDGHTLQQAADNCGCSVQTLIKWKTRYTQQKFTPDNDYYSEPDEEDETSEEPLHVIAPPVKKTTPTAEEIMELFWRLNGQTSKVIVASYEGIIDIVNMINKAMHFRVICHQRSVPLVLMTQLKQIPASDAVYGVRIEK